MKSKSIVLTFVSICLLVSFVGGFSPSTTVYAGSGDPFPPPPDSIPDGLNSDTTISPEEPYQPQEDPSYWEIALMIVKINI